MRQVDSSSSFTSCTDESTLWAAYYGHPECMVFAHESGSAWHELTSSSAANGGHLECMVYAHENGAVWNDMTTARAAGNGHVDCLAYAYEHGAPFHLAGRWAKKHGRSVCVAYLQGKKLLAQSALLSVARLSLDPSDHGTGDTAAGQ